jgi:hypothetical protein
MEGAGQLDHISKMNSFARKRDLTKLSWVVVVVFGVSLWRGVIFLL